MAVHDVDDDLEMIVALAAMDDSDSDVDEDAGGPEETVYVDVEGFRRMSNSSFKANFRIDRIIFERLIVVVSLHMRQTDRLKRLRTPMDQRLLMGLWPLFNPDTFRSSGLHFGKKRAVIHYHYRSLVEVLTELAGKYIKWPDALERDQIKTYFEEHYGYIGAVGCIDGVHIKITAPLENPENYVDRHHDHSILVQAVCDHRLVYRDVYAGNPGAIGDARNFQSSDLCKNLLTNLDMLSEGEHILGDSAYTLTDKLIIPYGDDGHVEEWMRTHNICLSACRSRVENSFALLRGKNRRLKLLPMTNPYLQRAHIMASFVLSNFIKLEGNECEGLPVMAPLPIPQEDYVRLTHEARELGAIKREFIANLLHPHY